MSKSNETPSTPPSDDPQVVTTASPAATATDLEEVVQQFWEKNRNLIVGLAAVILLAIIARNGWAAYQTSQVESAREEYAAAASDSAKQTFADDRAGTALAGVARLELADTAIADGRYADALSHYEAAAVELAGTPFHDRITLGQAMARLLDGQAEAGKAALQSVANDPAIASTVRGEAIYHLAALALAANDVTGLEALATQVDAVNPDSSWAQRVTLMRATVTSATPATAADVPAISFESP